MILSVATSLETVQTRKGNARSTTVFERNSRTTDSPADDARNTATYRPNPVGKKQGCKLESLQAAMEELLDRSTARKANRRAQSGIISLLYRADAVKIYNSFDLSEANRRKLSEIIKEFDKFAIGETNETYERYVFNSRDQKEGDSIDTYVGELRTLAQSCNFCTCLHDTLIRDRIVLGLRDGGTRKRLLRQGKVTLQKCIEMVKSDEVSNTHLKNMDQTTPEPQDAHKVKTTKIKKSERKNPKQTSRDNPNRKHNDEKMSTSGKPCDFCGRKHRKGRANCAAWGRVCGTCGKKNHFASQCKAKEKAPARKNSFIG